MKRANAYVTSKAKRLKYLILRGKSPMNEIKLKWDDLNPEEQAMAISNYQAVRTVEEQEECSWNRAENEAPLCRAFYRLESGAIEVDV